MEINFNTDKLIIIHYPAGAGGKFITMALALHPRILLQQSNLAKAHMKYNFPLLKIKNLVMWKLETAIRTKNHQEFSCQSLANFSSQDLEQDLTSDEVLCNDLWKELTNQNKFYFFMTEHTNQGPFRRYVNRKKLILTNYGSILKARNLQDEDTFDKNLPNDHLTCSFDMSSINDSNSFLLEIKKVLDFLDLEQFDDQSDFAEHLDELREKFLKSFTEGFDNGKWGSQWTNLKS